MSRYKPIQVFWLSTFSSGLSFITPFIHTEVSLFPPLRDAKRPEYPFSTKQNSIRYVVSCDDQELIFYQSSLSKRWGVEVQPEDDANLEAVLISCSEEDFYTAEKGTVPERWWKAIRRSVI